MIGYVRYKAKMLPDAHSLLEKPSPVFEYGGTYAYDVVETQLSERDFCRCN